MKKKKLTKKKTPKHDCKRDKDTILLQEELMDFLVHLKSVFPKESEDDIALATLFMLAQREAVEKSLDVAIWHLNTMSNNLVERYGFKGKP